MELLARAGIVRPSCCATTRTVLGLARISGLHGMRGVLELEHRVREQKFHALGVSALVDGIPASDRRYYPLCAKAVEPDIPVRIYSSMNYATDRPYDLGHRRHLDQVAIDFPADHHRRPRGLALGDAQGAGGALGRPRRTAARDLDQEYMALLLKDTVKEKSAWRPRTASARSCRPR